MLFWGLSDNLRIFGKTTGLSAKAASRRAEELISDLDLEEHKDKTETLSGGLKRRVLVGIASILIHPC